ncbi:ClbS/DfsB family four-helix bundle protein [Shimia sp. NS0008-38b]|uniref:ClbS/DfsB family four-helix bundle protein n=1 Tax=Shimia sp. NS0008-38b TaxID=3127653 RepID=UPI00310456E2
MPAAQTKDDLLAVSAKEFAKLQSLMVTVPSDVATQSIEENWSIRDVLVHRAHWIDLFLGWYADGQAGKKVAFPAPGYKWNQLAAYNETVLAQHADVSWEDAQVRFLAAHDRWIKLVSGLTQEALYGAPMTGGNNNWTCGRWAEAAGPSHYRSAAKFIRTCLKQASVGR